MIPSYAGHAVLPQAAPNPLEDFARTAFWQAQVPVTLLPGDVAGVTVISDFGERIHFPDMGSIQFFLAGFRLAEHAAATEAPANPWETLLVPEQTPGQQGEEPGGEG